jgi:hypothetical protein
MIVLRDAAEVRALTVFKCKPLQIRKAHESALAQPSSTSSPRALMSAGGT